MCTNCSTSVDTCTGCQGTDRSPPECDCDDMHYLDSINNICIDCNEGCISCDNITGKCTGGTCQSGYWYDSSN